SMTLVVARVSADSAGGRVRERREGDAERVVVTLDEAGRVGRLPAAHRRLPRCSVRAGARARAAADEKESDGKCEQRLHECSPIDMLLHDCSRMWHRVKRVPAELTATPTPARPGRS